MGNVNEVYLLTVVFQNTITNTGWISKIFFLRGACQLLIKILHQAVLY